jgi:molybdopterin-containing oxidoreductase family membrane subunit
VLAPQLLWFRRIRNNHRALAAIALGVVVGMWFERYSIVVVSLHHDFLPSAWGEFHGTLWDYLALYGSVGLFLTGYLLVVRLFPIIAMFEARERKP